MVWTSLLLALGVGVPDYETLVEWHPSVEAARAAAVREGKLLFIYYLVGDLDKEKC